MTVIFHQYRDKLPILKNLDKSLEQLKIDADKNFFTEEAIKRYSFYCPPVKTGKKSFADYIKVDSSKLNAQNKKNMSLKERLQEEIKQLEEDDDEYYKKKDKEQMSK